MTDSQEPVCEVPCVGAVVFDAEGRLLLIQRANPPAQGQWSLPGGRVEPGEELTDAVCRELLEETGLSGEVIRHVGAIRRDAPDGSIYVIDDYLMVVGGAGRPRAGDDARDVGWFAPEELAALDTSPGLVEVLRGWSLLD
jgi:ADP-ribose pyrophosphatase YjhB (NUDIX family)